ncbi:RecA-family ATPase [Sinorhizobium fredii]|uniref:RecA-family ATPase n=1 Tax=Sinorhizobium fredii (strain USDA 257) TaxID=1185652 RepID=I3X8F8_SINF2|nr:AAA family ATPase [Sinorhizobium fredii]AFL52164.1 RecA-family ATPase [Sinorhizobium fredii USDA 257]
MDYRSLDRELGKHHKKDLSCPDCGDRMTIRRVKDSQGKIAVECFTCAIEETYKKSDPPSDSNDDKPLEPLATFSVADFAGKPLPEREFLDGRHLFPARNVTLLQGDGGTGKSLLAMQLAMAVAVGGTWLGIAVKRGAVLYLSAEEDEAENHIRAAEIAAAEPLDLVDMKHLRISCLAGEDAALATEDKKGRVATTTLYQRLELSLENIKPLLIVLDNLADVFGGNEISRAQARQFIGMLRRLAIRFNCYILLLGHPSLTGINSGTGTSGSTAWSNSVRARLYLHKQIGQDGSEADQSVRVLETMKANYGPRGEPINLKWDCGRYICTDKRPRAGSDIGKADKARRIFLALLRLHNDLGINVSANPTANNYAPKRFYVHPKNDNVSSKMLETAMFELLEKGQIASVPYGPPSAGTRRLWVA